jgi:hypothetical protein
MLRSISYTTIKSKLCESWGGDSVLCSQGWRIRVCTSVGNGRKEMPLTIRSAGGAEPIYWGR